MGEAGTSPVRERCSGPGSPQGSGREPLAGGAGCLREQAQEGGSSVGKSRKLGHVADSFRKGDGGGPASEQGLKPLRRLAARVVGVEGGDAPTGQDGAGPRRPVPSTGLGPGNAWNRGVRSGSTARPTSQRTRPPEASGTTTIPANRSAPRSMNRPQSWSRSAEKPSDSRASRSPLPGA